MRIEFIIAVLLVTSWAFSNIWVSAATISAAHHSCAITANGGLYCWGHNVYGQLGDGTNSIAYSPVAVSGLSYGITSIAATECHTCALRSGSVYCWGNNANGQLGDTTNTNRNTAALVSGMTSGVTAILASYSHSCAIRSGVLYCWGLNNFGQLGDGFTTNRLVPVEVSGMSSGVTAVAGGIFHTCAIRSGAVYCWGSNSNCQLGDGTTTSRSTAGIVSGMNSGIVSIAIGRYHGCALNSGGALFCWGQNDYGSVGDGTVAVRSSPVTVSGMASGVTAIAAAGYHTCAIKTGGVLYCWGQNYYGQLNDGTFTDRTSPKVVNAIGTGILDIGLGYRHTCAYSSSMRLYCWGSDEYEQIGDGMQERNYPALTFFLARMSSIISGHMHTCSISTFSTSLYCWGNNDYGELGIGYSSFMNALASGVSGMSTGVTAASGGYQHTCAIRSGGLYCWGNGDYGQIGDGFTVSRNTPVVVSGMGSSVQRLGAGYFHTCAVRTGGAMFCWGYGAFGQLGYGGTATMYTATAVSGMTAVTLMSSGFSHTCAVNAGAMYCWGLNNNGQLGDGTLSNQLTPVLVSGMSSGVIYIAGGGSHTCAIKSGGVLYCWGKNTNGAIGDGTTIDKNTPTLVSSMSSGVVAVAGGDLHTCAILTSTLYCWGMNNKGQIGISNYNSQLLPVQVLASMHISSVAAGVGYTCALNATSISYCWGDFTYGQLGDGLSILKTQSHVLYGFIPTSQPSSQPSIQPSIQPSMKPSRQPSTQPSRQPSSQPSFMPSVQPSRQPTLQPSSSPSTQPTHQPSQQPTSRPSRQPSGYPSGQPTVCPSSQPTSDPSQQPYANPSGQPSSKPSSQPTCQPSLQPSQQPSIQSSASPSRQPSAQPSCSPSRQPTSRPTIQPSGQPTNFPSSQPSNQPSSQPSGQPTMQPASHPTSHPSSQPSNQPTSVPTIQPLVQPTTQPSGQPSWHPSCRPSSQPINSPSSQPSADPSTQPSAQPSAQPTLQPLSIPSVQPTAYPSMCPSSQPSCVPSSVPSAQPTLQPSEQPSRQPSMQPSIRPSSQPSAQPSGEPSGQPICVPSVFPSSQPSQQPYSFPTCQPSTYPTARPTVKPSSQPTICPTQQPTSQPSVHPTFQSSSFPTGQPSVVPSLQPISSPSMHPTNQPSAVPSLQPISSPSVHPTNQPSTSPTSQPSQQPISIPSTVPSIIPSIQPVASPSSQPSTTPTTQPSKVPSGQPSSQPSTHPTTQPSNQPTFSPTAQPTWKPSQPRTSGPTVVLLNDSYLLSLVSMPRSNENSNQTSLSSVIDVVFEQMSSAVIDTFLAQLSVSNNSLSPLVSSVTSALVQSTVAVVPLPAQNHTSENNNRTLLQPLYQSVTMPSSKKVVNVSFSPTFVDTNSIPVAVSVSVIELSTILFRMAATNSTANNTISTISVASALYKPRIVSDVVAIQLSLVSISNNESAPSKYVQRPTLPIFETILPVYDRTSNNINASNNNNIPNGIEELRHNCTLGKSDSVSGFCTASRVWMNLTCTGSATAVVKRKCPVMQTVCSVIDLEDTSILSTSYCQTIPVGNGVICRCGFDANEAHNRNKTSALFTRTKGKLAIAATQSYVSSDLDISVVSSDKALSGNVAQQSFVIIMTFAALWCIGTGLGVTSMSIQRKQPNIAKSDENAVSDRLDQYLTSIMPPALQNHGLWVEKIWLVLYRKHKLLSVCAQTLWGERYRYHVASPKKRLLTIVHVMTSLTMSCFILALFYDLQSPVDDGYCEAQTTQWSCEQRRTLLDPSIHFCVWSNPDANKNINTDDMETAAAVLYESRFGIVISSTKISANSDTNANSEQIYCHMNTHMFSLSSFVLSFLLTSFAAIVVSSILDLCIEILNKSTEDPSYRPSKHRRDRSLQISSSGLHQKVERLIEQQDNTSVSLKNNMVYDTSEMAKEITHRNATLTTSPFALSLAERLQFRSQLQRMYIEESIYRARDAYLTELSSVSNLHTLLQESKEVHAGVAFLLLLYHDLFALLSANNSKHTSAVQEYFATTACFWYDISDTVFSKMRSTTAKKNRNMNICNNLMLMEYGIVSLLVMMHGGSLYFLLAKAASRGVAWQLAFLRALLWEWVADVVCIQSFELWMVGYCLPHWLLPPNGALAQVTTFIERIIIYENKSEDNNANDNNCYTEQIMMSRSYYALAKEHPLLPEANIVLHVISKAFGNNNNNSNNNNNDDNHHPVYSSYARFLYYGVLQLICLLQRYGCLEISLSLIATFIVALVVLLHFTILAQANVLYTAILLLVYAIVIVSIVCYIGHEIYRYRNRIQIISHHYNNNSSSNNNDNSNSKSDDSDNSDHIKNQSVNANVDTVTRAKSIEVALAKLTNDDDLNSWLFSLSSQGDDSQDDNNDEWYEKEEEGDDVSLDWSHEFPIATVHSDQEHNLSDIL